jgi:hypothetical protein
MRHQKVSKTEIALYSLASLTAQAVDPESMNREGQIPDSISTFGNGNQTQNPKFRLENHTTHLESLDGSALSGLDCAEMLLATGFYMLDYDAIGKLYDAFCSVTKGNRDSIAAAFGDYYRSTQAKTTDSDYNRAMQGLKKLEKSTARKIASNITY